MTSKRTWVPQLVEAIQYMRFILQATALCALVLTRVSAEGSGLFLANGMELEEYRVGDEIMYGEPQTLITARELEGRDSQYTRCVGHHGLCTIGEGNCYAPDTCAFCGGCTSKQARCQNPQKEGCQCYP